MPAYDSPTPPVSAPRDRQLLIAVVLLGLFMVVRSLLIVHATSLTIDESFHFGNGLYYLSGDLQHLSLNDPPFGSALGALPAFLLGCRPKEPNAFLNQPLSYETIRYITAVWKTLLFWPLLAVIFQWCRTLFGIRAAWAAALLVAFEPTIAGHVHLNTLDVLGMEMIVISCYFICRYVEKPNWIRLFIAAASIAAGMLIKHTAIILPGVALLYIVLWFIVRPLWQKYRAPFLFAR